MRIRIALVVGFVLLCLPKGAAAEWGWLERLSGPGPFKGFDIIVFVHCWPRPQEGEPLDGWGFCPKLAVRHHANADEHGEAKEQGDGSADSETRSAANAPGVAAAAPRTIRHIFGVRVAGMWSSDVRFTDLPTDAPGNTDRVYLLRFEPTYLYRVGKDADLGVGMGEITFLGAGFNAFVRPVITPLLMNIRPFHFQVYRHPVYFEVRYRAAFLLGTISGKDFGNSETKFSAHNELLNQVGFGFAF